MWYSLNSRNLSLTTFILSLWVGTSGCTTYLSDRQGTKVHYTPSNLSEDTDYIGFLEPARRHVVVYENFETLAAADVVYFSEAFLLAQENREKRLSFKPLDFRHKIGSKKAFFVSIYLPDRANLDLDRDKNIKISLLSSNADPMAPESIILLRDKASLETFFKGVTPWSKEYLVVFPDVKESTSLDLHLGLPEARLEFQWR